MSPRHLRHTRTVPFLKLPHHDKKNHTTRVHFRVRGGMYFSYCPICKRYVYEGSR